MDAPRLTSVAIVAYSDREHGKFVRALMADDFFEGFAMNSFDLRDSLCDPHRTYRAEHGQDASYAKTLVSVVSQAEFPGMLDLQCKVIGTGQSRILFGCCTTGYHRADSWRRVPESVLNATLNADGERVWNAMSWNLIEERSSPAQRTICENARLWASQPWLIMPTLNFVYGHDWCMKNPAASANMSMIYDKIAMCRTPAPADTIAAVETAADRPQAASSHRRRRDRS